MSNIHSGISLAAVAAGNFVVVRVGDGGSTLTTAVAPVFLDEYSSTGMLVRTIALPTSFEGGGNSALMLSGTGKVAEGHLTRSLDNRYLVLAGYDGDEGNDPYSPMFANRVIARVDAAGNVDTTTSAGFSGTVNDVTTIDGTSFWISGSSGVSYQTFGASGSPSGVASFGGRELGIFGGQLYATRDGALSAIGSGTPTTGSQPVTNLALSGFSSGYDFFFADLDTGVAGLDTLYIADDNRGLVKYGYDGISWVQLAIIGTNADDYRGLAGTVSGSTVTLYATLDNGASADTIVSIVDTSGYNGTMSGIVASTLVTAASHTTLAFRGIAMAPGAALPTLSINDVSMAEGASGTTNFTFTVSLSLAAENDVTFDIATVDGTALAASDYTAKMLVAQVIPAGSTTYSFTVAVNGDVSHESAETFAVNVSNVNGTIVADARGQGTITNDDPNRAPTGVGKTINLVEDVRYAFTQADFQFSDPDGNGLAAIVIASLPAAGSLTLNNVAVTLNQVISAADITNLVFMPAANANGNGYASFTFKVRDNGDTLNGGINTDPTGRTITLNVAATNDAPIAILSSTPYVPQGGEIRVNSQTAGNQERPTVVGLADGRILTVWQDPSGTLGDNLGTSIKGRFISASGVAGDEFLINSQTAGDQGLPTLAALSDGGFVVTWQDSGGTLGDSSGTSIKARIFDSGGIAVGSEFLVNDQGPDGQYEPHVAALSGNGFVITWYDDSRTLGDNSELSIKARIFDGSGTPAGPEFLVNSVIANSQFWPDVTTLANGNFVVTWHDNSHSQGDGDGNSIKGKIYSATGVALTGDFLINTSVPSDQREPSVTALAGGGFVVVWEDGHSGTGDSSRWGITGQIFNAGGGRVGGEFLVNTTTAGDQRNPEVTGLADGGFVVTWRDPSGTLGDTSGSSIKGRIYTAAGVARGNEFLVNTATGNNQEYPTVTPLAGGGFAIVWYDQSGTLGDPSGTSIKMQVYDTGFAATEGILLNLKGLMSAIDVDAGSGTMTVTLSVGDGALTLTAGNSGVQIVSGNGTASVQVSGTLTQINALLGSASTSTIRYGASDAPPASTVLTFAASDGAITANARAVIDIAAVNDPTFVGGSIAARNFVEGVNGAADHILVNSSVTLTDPDDTTLTSVTVSITSNFVAAQDVLAFVNTSADTFGDISGSYNVATGVLTLTSPGGAATLAQFEAAVRAVSYDNNSEEPNTATRTVQVVANDGDGNSSALTFTILVTAQNDSPTGTSSTIAINEDSTLTLTTAHLGFSDVDGDSLMGVRFGQAPTGGTLYYDSDGAGGAAPVAITNFPTTTYPTADITAGKLTFVPTAHAHGTGAASINFEVVDNGGTAGTGQNADISPETLTIDINSVNDAPVNFLAKAAVSGTEDSDLLFNAAAGNSIQVTDADGDALTVTLEADHGTLTLSRTTGLTFDVGDGTGDATMTFSGTALAINAALNGLTYRGNLNYRGDDTLSVATSDGTVTDTDTVGITLADDGIIEADSGNNSPVNGTNGPDLFHVQQGGNDTVNGLSGDDMIYFGQEYTTADSVDGGEGRDTLILQGNYSLGSGLGTMTGIEKVTLLTGSSTEFGDTAGSDYDYSITMAETDVVAGQRLVVFAQSLGADETLTFNGLAETDGGTFQVFGGADNDNITGGSGNDHLLGRAGDDYLRGGPGDDLIRGGLGADTLRGGFGADTFVYDDGASESTGVGFDRIVGFNQAVDNIDLPTDIVGWSGTVSTGQLRTSDFDADLAAAVNGVLDPNSAVLFTPDSGDYTGRTFGIFDLNGDGSYQVGQDIVIEFFDNTAPIDTTAPTSDYLI